MAIQPTNPRLIDAYARTLLATGDLDRAQIWAEERISRADPKAPSALATTLTTCLVAKTRRKMIELYGPNWTSTVKSTSESADARPDQIGAEAERRLEHFLNGSVFAAHKKTTHPVQCPACGENQRILRRNRVALTNAYHLYFDFGRLAEEVLGENQDDVGAIDRAERVLRAVTRSNPDYFTVGLCECGACGVAYVDHPFNVDQVNRYYASQARAYEIGGQPLFSRAHAYDWVRSKAAPISYLYARLDKPLTGLSFLDAGCGEGIMCALMRLLGAEVFGIEPNTRASRYAREILELNGVVEGLYGEDCFPGREFDIVLSHHTMEHALNPPEFARCLARHTGPGGHLLLQVPRADTDDDNHLVGIGNFHLFGFRRAYLKQKFIELGFDLMEVQHFLPSAMPPNDQIDPVTEAAFWGEYRSQISILCIKKVS